MIMQKLRKQGNSLGITIPREELDRLGLAEGDLVAVDINRLEVRPAVSPELRSIFDRVLHEYREGIDYLRDK
jgi:antitoxin component of MazEF toxin-antitoxin module